MAAQVEVQAGEVGRTVAGGRLHLNPLTDSSNKSLIEIQSINQSRIIASEPNKPVPAPKPRLSPKPFAVERNTTIKPILAPKPQAKPRPESTRFPGYKPEPPSHPKPQQPLVTGKPRPVSTNTNRPAPTSFITSNKLNTGQTTKPVAQPFKPAPPFDPEVTSKPAHPADKQKAAALSHPKSFNKLPAAEWSGTTQKEDDKDQNDQSKGGTSITRAKSMGFLLDVEQEEGKKEKAQPETSVPLRTQPRSSRPRPVSAIFPESPTKKEAPVPSPRWTGRRPLSADLTSKFESIGLTLHRNSPKADTQEDTSEEKTLPQKTEPAGNPFLTNQSVKKPKERAVKETHDDKHGASIKSRIGPFLDSSPSPVVTGQGSDSLSSVQPAPETEPTVGVKKLIKQLTEDTTPNQSPVLKPVSKSRPLPLDLTKKFSSERSPDLGPLIEAADRHDTSKDPQWRVEESVFTPNEPKTFMDLKDSQEQLKKASTPPEPETSQALSPTVKDSSPDGGFQTVRASLFENVVEKHTVLKMDDSKSVNTAKESLSSPSSRRRDAEDEGTLVTATYKKPISPSSPMRVRHAFDMVQAIEENRAVSENVPSAQWEDKAMTLRSKRSDGSRPVSEGTSPAQGQSDSAVMINPQPRYLRVGALTKWSDPELDQNADTGKVMLKESQMEGEKVVEQDDVVAAPKRLKMLPTEEQSKPKATYFALTGQIQEPFFLTDAGTSIGNIDDYSARSQGKVLPMKRNPALDEAIGKTTHSHEQVEELMMKSHLSSRDPSELEKQRIRAKKEREEAEKIRLMALEQEMLRNRELEKGGQRETGLGFAFDGQTKEEMSDMKKKRLLQKETERHMAKLQEIEREKQRHLEMEKQAHREFARLKELEMQREAERQRQKVFKKQKELEERQKQMELYKQNVREMERQKQIELEKQRLQEAERERLKELERERQQYIEKEKRREAEMQERERQRTRERQRQREEERQRELDKERRLLELQKEKRQIEEMEWIKEQERQQLLEFQKQKQKEKERQQAMELEKQRLREKKEREEAEKMKQMALEQEMLRMRELDKEKERQKELERERQKEIEREKQRQEQERQQLLELQKQKQKEKEKLQLIELEKQRLRENKEREEAEKIKQLAIEQEMLQARELDKQRERQKEMEQERQKKIEWERQRELEHQKQRERQRQLDMEREEMEKQRLRQREQEKEKKRIEDLERLKEMERRELLKFEKEKRAEMDRQQYLELEKRRLREKIEKDEAEKMRQIAKHQEAERQRLKEKQRKEEQERLRQESAPVRPKNIHLDSGGLRNDPLSRANSQRSDPANRWKEPYKPGILDIDSFTSQGQHSPGKDLFPVSGIQGLDSDFVARPQHTPERDVSRKVPPQTSGGFSSPVWTTSPQDPWELRPVEVSVDSSVLDPRKQAYRLSAESILFRQDEQPRNPQRNWPAVLDDSLHSASLSGTEARTANTPGGLSSSTPLEYSWLPKELQPQESKGDIESNSRSQGSQEINRLRSRSVSRRSAPAGSSVEGNLARVRSRSAHRERDRHSWVPQKQSSEEEEGTEEGTPVRDTDSQYGTWETGLRTDESLTPATPSSESNLTPSPKKPIPPHAPGDPASSQSGANTPDGRPPSSTSDSQPVAFPDTPTALLDSSALRSRVQLGKKRAPRTRPSKAPRQSAAAPQEGATDDWLYRDSTDTKPQSPDQDSDSEEAPRGAEASPAAPSQPQRVALFPGMDPSALKAQLKKRGDSDNQVDGAAPSPSQLSRSPKSPFLPRAARVLPPPGGKENGEEDSPQWLKELKSKKRLSQYENDS